VTLTQFSGGYCISAVGGNGGDGSFTFGTGAGAGGGAGGSGGLVALFTNSATLVNGGTLASYLSARGGPGGAGASGTLGTGAAGSNGQDGIVIARSLT